MMLLSDRIHATFADRRGFVMPMVIFALMIMSTMAVVAINVSVNEHRSSRAVRTSLEALLAGITGLNEIQADWNDASATLYDQLDTLSSGGTIQIGWTNLASGASYKGEVMRIDNGGQELFLVTVDGRDGSGLPSERAVTAIFTHSSGELSLGACCDSAALVRGVTKLKKLENMEGTISGIDVNPPGWAAETCDGVTLEDRPGVIVEDANDVENLWGAGPPTGDPPILVATMADSTFDNYGGDTWDEVKAQADHIIGEAGAANLMLNTRSPGDPLDPLGPLGSNGLPTDANDNWIGPRHTDVAGTLVCNTAHPLNWGSKDPTDPCYDYHPVLLFRGEIELKGSMFGQGIYIMDGTDGVGSEFELEGCSYGDPWTGPIAPCTGVELAGIIIGRGCVEIQYESSFYGSVFVDGDFGQDSCLWLNDPPLSVDRNGSLQYSSCAVQRALEKSGVGQSESGGGVAQKIGSRWFAELVR